ncbi:RNA-binding S4 domain-containing protein [Rhodococcus sp. USK13]|uniref:RNA-binding S4 domain-containing protein n=1 Tax=Rhodococcus sp. USK13 TaxID=2806442 RepID=UPI001BD021BF|nr:RNA-binding S4 domain-containing protein [Rhodococcus sp. USK13]
MSDLSYSVRVVISGTDPATVRVDSWTWAVRLFKTRSAAAAACRSGHVRVNGSPAKPAQPVKVGDEVRIRAAGTERIVEVTRPIAKRVGAVIAAECYTDNTPPPPPLEVLASLPRRDRGAGRPTKRERREMDRLRGMTDSDRGVAEDV